MQALMVTIKIKAGHRDAFMEAMLSDARGSVHDEPGCLRFDGDPVVHQCSTVFPSESA